MNKDLKSMTDNQLIERVQSLVKRERELVECLIWHLQEIQDRRLFIQLGYTSLFECLVKHFRYSESVAYSRIAVLKIIKEVPAVTAALTTGELNITNLTLAQSFIRRHEKENDETISATDKAELISCLKNKTTQEAKQILAKMNPAMDLPVDRVQYLSDQHVQLQITSDRKLLEKIEYLKSLLSHENISPSYEELLNISLDAAIEKIEKKKGLRGKLPQEQEADGQENATQSFAVRNSRYISRKVRRVIFSRAKSQCEYVHSNGQRCGSKFQTQFDHKKAFSKGGGSSLENIQLLCRVHNAEKGDR